MSASVQLAPLPKQRFTDTATGAPLAGGLVFTYAAGTTTKQTSYTDSTGATPNTNPVVLDARGEAAIWLDETLAYKVVLSPSTDTDPPTAPIWTVDNIPAGGAVSVLLAATTTAGKLGFDPTLNYVAATIGRDLLNDPISPYQFPWLVKGDGTTDDAAAIQACVTFAKGHPILFEERTHVLGTSIECNDQTASGAYRPGAKILGQGIGKTVFINRSGGAAFKCTLTQTQGDNNYFARGTRFQGFDIITDGSSAAGSFGIALQGQYFPVLAELRLYGLLGDGIQSLTDARWTTGDRYSNGEISVERCIISGNSGWGINSTAFSNSWDISDCYTTANTGGGYYLAGTGHIIDGGSVAGNGATANANSGGIVLGRTTAGSSQISTLRGVEIDTNYNRQVWAQSQLTKIERCRFLDDATSGSFFSPNQIEIGGITGDTFDNNIVDQCYFRQTNMGAANITLVRVRLPVTDGTQTARYNEFRNPLLSTAGASTGVVTPFSVENSTSVYAQGNTYRSNGKLLYSSSAAGSSDRAEAIAYLSTSMAIPVTPTAASTVTANTIAFDSHSAYSTGAYTFTAPYTGVVDVEIQMGIFSGAANVGVTFGFVKNGTQYTSITCRDGNAQSFHALMPIVVASGDVMSVNVQQAAGGTAQLGSGLASFVSYRMR